MGPAKVVTRASDKGFETQEDQGQRRDINRLNVSIVTSGLAQAR